MRHELQGLRSDNLAHILALVGIASITRGRTRVGWSMDGGAFLLSDDSPDEIDRALHLGFDRMRADHADIINVAKTVASATPTKKQCNKGRQKRDDDDGESEQEVSGYPVNAVAERLDTMTPTARDAVPGVLCIAGNAKGLIQKTRAMLGKTWFCSHVATDGMNLLKLRDCPGVLAEFSTSANMAATTMNMTRGKVGTAFDHIGAAMNMGINQSLMGKDRRAHPYVEMLAIEGMKALPAFPNAFVLPTHRGMARVSDGNGKDITWDFPIWTPALDYFEIEDLLADSRSYATHKSDLREVRRFEIVTNGQLQMVRPLGVVPGWDESPRASSSARHERQSEARAT